jgi:type II secretory pathway pseudopilin PulG
MTLIESTLVILVMLVVFAGTRTWKTSSDRSACINNIRNVQHAVRSYQNQHGLSDRAPINIRAELIGPRLQIPAEPQCPSFGHYDYTHIVPPVGKLAVFCSLSETAAHHPTSYTGW